MSERDKRMLVQDVGLQLLYRVGQKSTGRMLNLAEMRQCAEAVEEFMGWYFGPAPTIPAGVSIVQREFPGAREAIARYEASLR